MEIVKNLTALASRPRTRQEPFFLASGFIPGAGIARSRKPRKRAFCIGEDRMKEKALEDYIIAHPNILGQGTQIIGRQLNLPSGRLDLLAWNDQVIIVELKIGELKPRDIAQVLRYKHDVISILEYIIEMPRWSNNERKNQVILDCARYQCKHVASKLIVKDADPSLIGAAGIAGIKVSQWEFCDDEIIIDDDGIAFLSSVVPVARAIDFCQDWRNQDWMIQSLGLLQEFGAAHVASLTGDSREARK